MTPSQHDDQVDAASQALNRGDTIADRDALAEGIAAQLNRMRRDAPHGEVVVAAPPGSTPRTSA